MSAAPDAEGAERAFFVLTLDDVRLEVDATRGGRITALRLGDRNLLSGAEVDAINYGSTFWTSPQSAWGWPPVAEIDEVVEVAAHGERGQVLGQHAHARRVARDGTGQEHPLQLARRR